MLIVMTNIKLYDLYISNHVQASTSICLKMIFKRQLAYHLLIKINLHEKCTFKMLITLKYYHRTLYHISFLNNLILSVKHVCPNRQILNGLSF